VVSASTGTRVRAADVADAAESARLQIAFLRHGFFPRLGHRFVRKWHVAHQDSPYGAHLVAEVDGAVAGFLLGTSDQHQHVNWMLEHRRRQLGIAGLGALLLRPTVFGNFLRTRAGRYARRLVGRHPGTTARTEEPDEPVAVLEAVVINPSARGLGAGSLLVECFLDLMEARGATQVELVTKVGPEGAAEFYEQRGWNKVDEHIDRDGEPALTYRIDMADRVAREPDPPEHGTS